MTYIPLAIYLAGFAGWLGWAFVTLGLRWDTALAARARKFDLPDTRSGLALGVTFLGSIWPTLPFLFAFIAWKDRHGAWDD